jgi:hypothetical protein
MRVLHVITGLAAGGAERQLHQLVRRQGGTAEVATLTNPGSVARAMRTDGTVVHEIGMRGNTDLSALARLVRLIRAGRYDVVHTHLYRACVYGRLAARLAGVRHVVATEHSLGERHIEGRRISPAVRRLYLTTERLGQSTIAVSAAVARRLVEWGVPPHRTALADAITDRIRRPEVARAEGTAGARYAARQADIRRTHDALACVTVQLAAG